MLTAQRYLHFDNVDLSAGQIVCSCSCVEWTSARRRGQKSLCVHSW